MPAAERTIIINTPVSVLYNVITDYEKYPEFLQEVSNVEIVSRTGNIVRAKYTVKLIKTISYVIDLTENENASVKWNLVESSIMKSNVGGWTLKDLGDGRTEATYGLDVVVKGLFVPGSIRTKLTEGTLPSTLEAFKRRAEGIQ